MATHSYWVIHSPYPDGSWRGIEKCYSRYTWARTPELFESKEQAELAASGLGLLSKGFVPVEVELKVPDVRGSLMKRVWILYVHDDEDAPILESFESKPTKKYIENTFGEGALYEYDMVSGVAVNGRRITPK